MRHRPPNNPPETVLVEVRSANTDRPQNHRNHNPNHRCSDPESTPAAASEKPVLEKESA
jgi:hypothetical protein